MDESSVGMMKFPTEWKNKSHVPNHTQMNIAIYCNIALCGNTSSGLSSLRYQPAWIQKNRLPVIRAGGTLAHFSLVLYKWWILKQVKLHNVHTCRKHGDAMSSGSPPEASVFAFLMHGFVSKLGTTTSIRTSFSTLERQYRGEFLICISLNPNNIL